MNVLIDSSAITINHAGVSVYVENLMKSLRNLNDSIALTEIKYTPIFKRNSIGRVYDSINRDLLWQDKVLLRKATKEKIDLIHYPAFTVPHKAFAKEIVTIHDAYTLRSPHTFKIWHRFIVNNNIKKAINKGIPIITPSDFTKQEILSFYPEANKDIIYAIQSGISEHRHRINDTNYLDEIKTKYRLYKPFILSVSTIEPRKNFSSLLKAFSRLKNDIEHDLVVVGEIGWKSKKLMSLLKELNLNNRIKFTGYINDSELNALYSTADCFVFPSYYEGFGFTPLEAMKCGCPVLSSNASCMPEILMNGALYFNPSNIEEIASTMLSMLKSEKIKLDYSIRGNKIAEKYNWNSTAAQTLEVYKTILGKNNY